MSNRAKVSLRRAAELISEIKNAAVAVHRSPDADAVGSALAVIELIEAMGGKAVLLSADPIPEPLAFLVGERGTVHTPPEGKTLIAVDVASAAQLGGLSPYADDFSLMIDHHLRGEVFADNLVDPDAAACGEIIYKLAKELESMGKLGKLTVTKKTWDFIFAAISSDTGSFRLGNTTPETHRIAAELMERGADSEYISRMLHAVKTKREIIAERIALSNMEFYFDGRFVLTAVSGGEIAEAGLKNEDFSDISDKMRSVSGALAGASMREIERGIWRVSLRANVPVDCASVAARLGGGGHTQAAGCSIEADTAEAAAEILLPIMKEAIETYENRERKRKR